MMIRKEEKVSGEMRDIRAIDMAEYLYDKLNKYGALTNEVRKLLEKIIVEMKDRTFEEMDNIFGVEGNEYK